MASKRAAAVGASSSEPGASNAAGESAGEAKVKKLPRTTEVIHPTTLNMVMEAMRHNADRRGASVQAIRTYILSTYPSVDSVKLRLLLRRALCKGMERGMLVRPTNSTATGATGRFKLAPVKPRPQKKVSENTDPNGEQAPKKVAQKKPKMVARKPKAKPTTSKGQTGQVVKKKANKKGTASDGEAMAPKAKKRTEKAPKVAAKKPKEKSQAAVRGAAAEGPAGDPKGTATKGAAAKGKKEPATMSKEGEAMVPKAKKQTEKAPKVAAKKPKEKSQAAVGGAAAEGPAGDPKGTATKGEAAKGKKEPATMSKEVSSTEDSAKPAGSKRGKK